MYEPKIGSRYKFKNSPVTWAVTALPLPGHDSYELTSDTHVRGYATLASLQEAEPLPMETEE